ncbi:MAG: indole-3-glycerol phosphate synthase TrpC [Thermoanaerobaculia bacterium]
MSGGALPDILERIVAQRRARVTAAPATEVPAGRDTPLTVAENDFLAALARRRGRSVIAEVKLGSPRLGDLRDRVDPLTQAQAYAEAGAVALSVVVEPDFFHGSYELLRRCQEASGLPALAKDFVVDPRQLEWARDAGADAVLLIAALQPREALHRLAASARALGLAPLVEIHTREDADKLAGADWELIGINHRDLRIFEVDLELSRPLLPHLPPDAFKVAESGIRSPADVERLAALGFDAFLIGETLLTADDPATRLEELLKTPEGP